MTQTRTPPAPSQLVRDQIERGLGLPRELYLSEVTFRDELELIFERSWLYAGHESELDQPGRYVTVESGVESVIVVRQDDGSLAAHRNVCRHRGARLLDPGSGTVRRIVCPYHQWVYRLDGTLQGATRMPSEFDAACYPLAAVRLETWHGLVFVNLSPDDEEPIADLLRIGEETVQPFDLAGARVAHRVDYEVSANWKLVIENSQECYHCTANHPEFVQAYDVRGSAGSEWQETSLQLSADQRVQVARFLLKGGARSLTVDGEPASNRPMGRFATGLDPYTVAIHLKPTFFVVCCPDYAVVLTDHPVAVDRTRVSMSWLVAAGATEGTDYDLENLIRVWDQTNRQDWQLCERTQQGVRSRSYVAGPLSADEAAVARFHAVYADLLARGGC